jgi:hypothetical protein
VKVWWVETRGLHVHVWRRGGDAMSILLHFGLRSRGGWTMCVYVM